MKKETCLFKNFFLVAHSRNNSNKKKKTQIERQEGKKKTHMMWNGRM
jgi:hypothetical protein